MTSLFHLLPESSWTVHWTGRTPVGLDTCWTGTFTPLTRQKVQQKSRKSTGSPAIPPDFQRKSSWSPVGIMGECEVLVVNLIVWEPLFYQQDRHSWGIESLGRVLQGAHPTRTASTLGNPDHFNPARAFNRMSHLDKGHGQSHFSSTLQKMEVFGLSQLDNIIKKFALVISRNIHAIREDFLQLDNVQQYGSANNLLLVQPTVVGQNGWKATLKEKFAPYFATNISNAWTDFMGLMANQDHKEWTECPKLGAHLGLEQLGFAISNTNATWFAFGLIYHHLDTYMSDNDKQAIGFSGLFVEHILCKIVHWTRKLKSGSGINSWSLEDYAEGACKHLNDGKAEKFPFPTPLCFLPADEDIVLSHFNCIPGGAFALQLPLLVTLTMSVSALVLSLSQPARALAGVKPTGDRGFKPHLP
ncbi:hypothetical protein DFP72DRAFT_842366 [Ephemerocybe angulata]|uniref:Uncharacterized protein n=1 Tax=Ephemerocybe angulata TaxID=980116 RepID=A0A8H6I9L5_9AGAR|nr:hypothetical protein DFP72DRAFT_842366 [Tulosesus angulatus]